MKKILALILTLAMMLTMLNVGFVASAADEIPAEAVAINSYEGLLAMEEGKYYYLTADITLGSPEVRENVVGDDGLTPSKDGWTVTAAPTEAELITIPAGATLDGNGHTIYHGYYVANPGMYTATEAFTSSLGWTHEIFAFGAGATATLKNVNIGDADTPVQLDKLAGTKYSGDMIAIFANTGVDHVVVIENVSVYAERNGRGLSGAKIGVYFNDADGKVTFNGCTLEGSYISAGAEIGGYVATTTGEGSELTFNNCVVNARLLGGSKTIGGFVNRTKDNTKLTFNGCQNIYTEHAYSAAGGVGGFIWNPQGAATTVSFVDCVNYANIDMSYTIGAGMLGRTNGAVKSVNFENCINYGDIKGKATTSNHGFGGLAGHTGAVETYTVKNCKNFGTITGGGFSAGIIGYKEGDAVMTIDNCVNYGVMSGVGSGGHGAIAGQLRASTNTIKNCVNYAPITTKQYAGGIVACNMSGDLVLENCINYADMVGVHAVAGLVAQLQAGSITANNCLTIGDIDQYSVWTEQEVEGQMTPVLSVTPGEGLGGFFGRVNSNKVAVSATNCVTLGTVHGSTKNNAWGAFGDTFGQFVGLYTVSNGKAGYNGDLSVGGFYDWTAEGASKPTFTNCYAYGTAVVGEGAMSLAGWITSTPEGIALDAAQASTIPVTEAPNGGLYGINVDAVVEGGGTLTDAATAIANVKELFNVDVMEGADGENALVIATPALRGYQESTDGNSVRFLSTVDSYNYEAVGYVYSVTTEAGGVIANNVAVTANYVLKAVSTGVDGQLETKNATDLGGEYFIALTFRNVPQEGLVEITVTPTADTYSGTAYTLTIMDGVVIGCVAE